jgi:hypothetical protein
VTKDELVEVGSLVEGAWNLNLTPDRRKEMLRAWWRYLHDLEQGDVLKIIDELVIRNGPPPRVGEVRKRVIDLDGAALPEIPIARQQAEEAIEASNAGRPVPEIHQAVATALRQARWSLKAFDTIYKKHYEGMQAGRYGVE